jgi:hypothetical protein
VEWVLDIFTEDFITFKSDSSEIVSKIEHNWSALLQFSQNAIIHRNNKNTRKYS